jgi:hypothetical protein
MHPLAFPPKQDIQPEIAKRGRARANSFIRIRIVSVIIGLA